MAVLVRWGAVRVDEFSEFKDAKLYPGGACEWDWSETGTRHHPGVQPDDVDELLEHGATTIVLSTGMEEFLEVSDSTVDYLLNLGVNVHVLDTPAAVELYNSLVSTTPCGALIHSTC